jgi:cytochrome P450/NADPH-cytochrome P450 reductase
VLARYATDPDEAEELLAMSGLDEAGRGAYRERVAAPRRSVLELLDDFESCDLPFNVYLELLPPMRPRYYSISSSPAVTSSCHLTVGVLHGPARSGDGYFNGVASNHLGTSMEGSTQFTFVRKPTIPFRPPANPHVPMIMVGAGTGMAPFRGFLQERAALAEKGVPVGKSILFYGCRNAKSDMLYADELNAFEESGITELQVAFSREPGQPRTFVQHLIERERDQVWDLIETGAVIYVCGNASTMAPGVRAALMDLYRAKTNGSDSTADEWLAGLRDDDRYLEDIWGEMASGL